MEAGRSALQGTLLTVFYHIRAIEKNKIFAGIPFGFHFIRFWQGIFPTRMFDVIFGEWFGIYHTMDNFTGRVKQQQSQDSNKKVS